MTTKNKKRGPGRPRKPKQVGIVFEAELFNKLAQLAQDTDRSVSGMARHIVRIALEDSKLWQ